MYTTCKYIISNTGYTLLRRSCHPSPSDQSRLARSSTTSMLQVLVQAKLTFSKGWRDGSRFRCTCSRSPLQSRVYDSSTRLIVLTFILPPLRIPLVLVCVPRAIEILYMAPSPKPKAFPTSLQPPTLVSPRFRTPNVERKIHPYCCHVRGYRRGGYLLRGQCR